MHIRYNNRDAQDMTATTTVPLIGGCRAPFPWQRRRKYSFSRDVFSSLNAFRSFFLQYNKLFSSPWCRQSSSHSQSHPILVTYHDDYIRSPVTRPDRTIGAQPHDPLHGQTESMSTALDKSLDDVSVLKFCPLAARRLAMCLISS